MAERSFKSEVAKLRLGAGEEFRGEGILAVTKAILQSGVAYVGGYQGAPVSHLVDVLVESQDLLDELPREQLLPYSTAFVMITGDATYQKVAEAAEAAEAASRKALARSAEESRMEGTGKGRNRRQE